MESSADSLGPAVDVALLADSVQAVRGKLYVLGGGWDTLWVRSFPARHPSLAIGIRLRVPVSWSGDSFDLAVELQDADGSSLLSQPLSHAIRVPPRTSESLTSDLGLVRSFTFNNLVFQKAGMYSFVILVDTEPVSRLRFAVRQRPNTPPRAS